MVYPCIEIHGYACMRCGPIAAYAEKLRCAKCTDAPHFVVASLIELITQEANTHWIAYEEIQRESENQRMRTRIRAPYIEVERNTPPTGLQSGVSNQYDCRKRTAVGSECDSSRFQK